MNINGVDFEVIRPRKNVYTMLDVQQVLEKVDGNTLYKFYERPSSTKQELYEDWRQWKCNTDGVFAFGVSSGNCYTFTLMGCYQDSNYNTYILFITKASNKAYLVSA